MVSDVEAIIQNKMAEMRKRESPKKHPLYRTWLRLRRQNKSKELKVCADWINSFDTFVSDVSPQQKNKMLIPINKSVPMGKNNFFWASREDFAAIVFHHKKYLVFGEYLSVPEISAKFGISPQLLRYRIRRGYNMAALITPPRERSR